MKTLLLTCLLLTACATPNIAVVDSSFRGQFTLTAKPKPDLVHEYTGQFDRECNRPMPERCWGYWND